MYYVYLNNDIAGSVQVQRKGLYYEITCCCDIRKVGHNRIYLSWGSSGRDLGVCAPFDGGFGFKTMVPVKAIGEGELRFTVSGKKNVDNFVAVYTDQPFCQLGQIRTARFAVQNGQIGVILPVAGQRGSGQNP